MKKMRWIALLLTTVLLLGLLTGCGSAAKMDNEGNAMAPTGDGIYENGSGKEDITVETGRKLIRTVTIRAETADQDALLADLDQKVAQLGGYVQNKNVSNYQSTSRNASLVLRIPADKLDDFVDHVQGETNILSVNESAEDVTMSYVDIQARVSALETEEARLLELIEKAENLSALLQLESKLTEVRTQLEKYKSQLKVYDNLVDYATVNLTITEVREYTVVEEEEPSTWQRIGTGFRNSLQGVWTILQEVFVFLVVALPYMVMLAIVPGIVLTTIYLVKRAGKKRRKHQDNIPE